MKLFGNKFVNINLAYDGKMADTSATLPSS